MSIPSATTLTLCLTLLTLVGCGQSREEELQAQHTKGAELVEDQAALVQGVGDALQKEGQAAAESVTAGVGHLVKGIAQGVDKVESAYAIETSSNASAQQLRAERAVMISKDVDGKKGIKAYVFSANALKGTLHLRALDAKGQEVGRSLKVDTAFDADDAAYVEFRFDPATPFSRINKLVLHYAATAGA
ncbi:hypothetical protein ACTSKR_10035 [Chitinibacteraceae bacterium HSL-7]